jgi:hypothetical protein
LGLAGPPDGSSGTLSAPVPVDRWPYLAVAVQVVGTITMYSTHTSSKRKTTQVVDPCVAAWLAVMLCRHANTLQLALISKKYGENVMGRV